MPLENSSSPIVSRRTTDGCLQTQVQEQCFSYSWVEHSNFSVTLTHKSQVNTHTHKHTHSSESQLTHPIGSLLDRWHLHTGGGGTQIGFESGVEGVVRGGGESINRIV